MKLSNLTDEDLKKVALLKTRKGIATSEARRAQQILYTRHVTHGGFNRNSCKLRTHIEANITRDYKSFEELNGCSIEEWQKRERDRLKRKGGGKHENPT